MSDFYCFSIGTGHNRAERTNLLVRLWSYCRSDDKWINDGVGSESPNVGPGKSTGLFRKKGWDLGNIQGWGIKKKTDDTVLAICAEDPLPTNVYLAGHSRGAILSVRIAAKLYDLHGKKIKCHLFLLDPVLMTGLGSSHFNRQIHPNVENIRVVVMEDVDGPFDLKIIQRGKTTAAPRTDLSVDKYIRLPGSHGTASQTFGGPIGQLTYYLARRELNAWGGSAFSGDQWSDLDFIKCYTRIQEFNPQRIQAGKVKRIVNDEDVPGGFKLIGTQKRVRKMEERGIINQYRGHKFFVNAHHYELFQSHYPDLGDAAGKLFLFNKKPLPYEMRAVRQQFERLQHDDTNSADLFQKVFPELSGG